MKDTIYRDNWLFYHDALTLMKAEDCKNWMKQNGIFKHWILPMNDLNYGTPYFGHPIGNSPELMPLDCSLFADLKRSVQYHVLLTSKLDEVVDKQRKFSISTINRGVYTYLRLLAPSTSPNAGSPPSSRIVEDINSWVTNIEKIYNADSIMLVGIGNRNGCRSMSNGRGNRGGKRIKGEGKSLLNVAEELWIHPDAKDCMTDLFENALFKINLKKEKHVNSAV